MRNVLMIQGRQTAGLTALAAAALLAGCFSDGADSTGVAPLAIQALNSQARYQVVLKDAITGERITDSLSVTFTGAADLKAADGSSLNGKTITTTDGLVALGATFSATAKEFSVLVGNRTLGWVETGTRVVADTKATGDQIVELKLVNVNKATAVNASSAPVAMTVTSASAGADGKLAAPVALATASKTVTNAEGASETIGSSTLGLSTGTTGKAADGTVAAAGPLTVSATHYANADVSSMSAFPGGFAATVSGAPSSVLNGASANDGAFVTGGFAQFNVTDSNGKAIKTFDKPVAVSIDLPKSSLDANGNALVPGVSKYPIWSFNDSTGEWQFEKEGLVVEKTPVDANNYTVKFETNHLSSWNLDFYGASCTAQINLTGRPAGDARPLEVNIVGTTGQRFSRSVYPNDSQVTLYRVPSYTRMQVKVLDRGQLVGQTTTPVALCSGAVRIPVTLQPIPMGTVLVETSESCADGTSKRPLPTFAWVYDAGRTWRNGYTKAASSTATVASWSQASLVTGSSTVYAYNPRSNRYDTRTVNVSANATATAAFNFTMDCPRATGASGSGS